MLCKLLPFCTISLATTFKNSWEQQSVVEKYDRGPASKLSQNSYFCHAADTPKVQVPYQTMPGQIPRKLQIERYVCCLCAPCLTSTYCMLCREHILYIAGLDSLVICERVRLWAISLYIFSEFLLLYIRWFKSPWIGLFWLLVVMTNLCCYILFSHRCRRKYLQLDFEQLLEKKGIDSNVIMPRCPSSSDEHVNAPDSPVSPYLPLEASLLQSLIDWLIPHSGVYSKLSFLLFFT